MFEHFPRLDKKITKSLDPVLFFFHKKLKLKPSCLSLLSGLFGFLAILFIWINQWILGLVFIIISQIFDVLDGQVAKKYNLKSKKGYFLDFTIDKLIEFGLIFSFAFLNKVGIRLAVLAAITLAFLSLAQRKTKFDIGFKKIGMFAGYLIGFNLAFLLVIISNIIGIVGTLIILLKNKTKLKLL